MKTIQIVFSKAGPEVIYILHKFRFHPPNSSEEETLLNESIKISVFALALAATEEKKKNMLCVIVPSLIGLLRSSIYASDNSNATPFEESQHNTSIQILISLASKHPLIFKDVVSMLSSEDKTSFEKSVIKMQLLEQKKARELEEKKKKSSIKKETMQKLDFNKFL